MSELVWTGPKFPSLRFHIKSTAMVTHASMWNLRGSENTFLDIMYAFSPPWDGNHLYAVNFVACKFTQTIVANVLA